jgi:hypothetical protein
MGSQGDFQYTGYKPERFSPRSIVSEPRLRRLRECRLLQQLADILATDRPALFLYRHDVPTLAAKRVHGLAAVGDKLDLRSVWVDP